MATAPSSATPAISHTGMSPGRPARGLVEVNLEAGSRGLARGEELASGHPRAVRPACGCIPYIPHPPSDRTQLRFQGRSNDRGPVIFRDVRPGCLYPVWYTLPHRDTYL